MPEGDSIHWLAEKLRRAVGGKVIRAASAQVVDAASLVGRTVSAVEARGKNLLVRFDDGRTLHVHLRMLGRVRIEAPHAVRSREALRGRYQPQIRLELDGAIVTGRRIPVLRLLRAGSSPELEDLGPDLLGETFDEAAAIARLRALGSRSIGEAVMLQHAVSGIGNVYKSEILFLERIHPEASVSSLDDAALARLLARAQKLLRLNVRGGPRRTRSSLAGPRLWVYGRGGEACLVCNAPILRILQGAAPGRSTYFCPACQVQSISPCPERTDSSKRSAPSSPGSRSRRSAPARSNARSTSRSR